MLKKVLIIQNYNANKGDDSVVSSMLESLRTESETKFFLTSYDPRQAEQTYGVKAEDFLLNGRNIRLATGIKKYVYMIEELLFLTYMPLWYWGTCLHLPMPLSAKRRKVLALYHAADVVILPGGHFFTSFNGLFTNLSHFVGISAAFALRKKTMIYAQTLGPFWGWKGILEKFMLLQVLKKIDVITVRDQSSLTKFHRFCKNIHLTADIVFAMQVPQLSKDNIELLQTARRLGRKLLGVTIHHIYYRHFFSREQYVSIMAESLQKCVKEFNLNLFMIPMENGMHQGGDRKIIAEILERSGIEKERIVIPSAELSSADTAALIAGMDYFIGTKTHSVAYGLKGGIPTLGIVYQEKTREFMKLFNQTDYALDLKGLQPETLFKTFSKLIMNQETVRATLKEKISEISKLALSNNQYLRELLEVE